GAADGPLEPPPQRSATHAVLRSSAIQGPSACRLRSGPAATKTEIQRGLEATVGEPRTLAFVGDIMLGRGVNAELARRPPESLWGSVLPLLRSADAVIANLECAITRHPERWCRTPKVFWFRADPLAVGALPAAGVRCVSLAY